MKQFYTDADPSCYYGSDYKFFLSYVDGIEIFTVVEEDRGPQNARPGDWFPETSTTQYSREEFMEQFSRRNDVIAALSKFLETGKPDGPGQE
jgi:hypothetical protein